MLFKKAWVNHLAIQAIQVPEARIPEGDSPAVEAEVPEEAEQEVFSFFNFVKAFFILAIEYGMVKLGMRLMKI